MKAHKLVISATKLGLILACTMNLVACQSDNVWGTAPDFGSTVKDAVQSQLVNPSAPDGNQKVVTGLDGASAKSGVDNYQKSFEVKVPTSVGTYPTGATYGTVAPGSAR